MVAVTQSHYILLTNVSETRRGNEDKVIRKFKKEKNSLAENWLVWELVKVCVWENYTASQTGIYKESFCLFRHGVLFSSLSYMHW